MRDILAGGWDFRARVSAAPLKPFMRPENMMVCATLFPRSRERGPVEALPPGLYADWLRIDFRARVSAAPLKPSAGARSGNPAG